MCTWKGWSIIIAFSCNSGYSLMLLQVLTSDSILKVSSNVESEITSLNFSRSDTLKPFICLILWMGLSPMHNFVISCVGHVENTGSLSYADLPSVSNLTLLFRQYPKVRFHEYHHQSHEKIFKYYEAVKHTVDQFPKILIFAWMFKFYHWQQIPSVLPQVTGLLDLFLRTYLPNIQVWMIIVC